VNNIEIQCTGLCKSAPAVHHLKRFILMSVKILSQKNLKSEEYPRSVNNRHLEILVPALWIFNIFLFESHSGARNLHIGSQSGTVTNCAAYTRPACNRLQVHNYENVEFCAIFLYLYSCVIWFIMGNVTTGEC